MTIVYRHSALGETLISKGDRVSVEPTIDGPSPSQSADPRSSARAGNGTDQA